MPTMATMTYYPSQPMHQPASLHTPPTHSSNLSNAAATCNPVDLAALQQQILCMMQEAEWIYPLLVTAIQHVHMQKEAPQNPPPTPCNSLTAPAHLNPSPAPPVTFTTHLTQTTLSMMEWLTLNNKCDNNTLWIPNALHWHHTLHWTREQKLPTHPLNCIPRIFPLLATALTSANNTLAASHDIVSGNPALATHVAWLATCQCHHQHPIQLPWTTNLMALDHNLWPP